MRRRGGPNIRPRVPLKARAMYQFHFAFERRMGPKAHPERIALTMYRHEADVLMKGTIGCGDIFEYRIVPICGRGKATDWIKS